MKVIKISGPTGSGKTTLSKRILNKFQNGVELSTDNYYKTGLMSNLLSKIIDGYFDRKISFNYKLLKEDLNFIINNGESIYEYKYNFDKKNVKKSLNKKSNINYFILDNGMNTSNEFIAPYTWNIKNFLPEFFGGFKKKIFE